MSEPFGRYPYGSHGNYPAPEPPRRHHGRHLLGLTATAAVAAAVGAGAAVGLSTGPHSGTNATPTSKEVLSTSQIASRVDPALVDVTSTLGYAHATAKGTGIVLTANGEILTNNHVISGATSVSVTDIGNGKTYKASVVGYDESHDIAVLRLAGASGLTTAATGNSDTVSVGDKVVGLGNAGGLGGTPSVAPGTVTALSQSITATDASSGSAEHLTGLIETNANIQPGDSGGPLVNSHGQVIGIDTAASQNFQFGGFGNNGSSQAPQTQAFAIPINTALSVAKQIKAGDASASVHIGPTAFIGLQIANSSQQYANGVEIAGTQPGTPAYGAGLTSGDIVTALDGHPVTTGTEIEHILIPHHPGDKVSISWIDPYGQSHTATLTLIAGPSA